jgi:cytoskeletal protein RodZ
MLKRLSKFLLLAALPLSMAGCGVIDELPFGSSQSSTVSQQSGAKARPVRPVEAKKPNAGTTQSASTTTISKNQEGTKPSETTKEENASRVEASSVNLVGLDQTQVAKILGPPMAETAKAPGKVWRYWNSRCAVDVSMYLDIQSRAYRVLSYEVTNHDSSTGGRSACLAELPKSNLQPASASGR